MERFLLFLNRLKYICQKELLDTLNDPATRVVLFLPAILQSLLFGYVATYNLENVPYALLDQSKSKTSIALIEKLDGSGVFHRVNNLSNTMQIAQSIDSGDAVIVVNIGPDFEAKLVKGETAPIQVITDGRNTMTASVALGYISSIVSNYNVAQNGNSAGVDILTRTWYNPNQITRWNYLPGMIATISFAQVFILAGLSVAREREKGTFDQLLVTPLSPLEILIGKSIPALLIGLVQSTFVLAVCYFWFKIPMAGSLFTLYLTLAIFTISCIGIGLSISAVSQNMQQVMVYSLIFMMPMFTLSGLSTPVNNMPQVLQTLTYANPVRFGVESVRRIYLEGSTLAEIAPNFIPMICVAIITLPIAAWLFRNKLV